MTTGLDQPTFLSTCDIGQAIKPSQCDRCLPVLAQNTQRNHIQSQSLTLPRSSSVGRFAHEDSGRHASSSSGGLFHPLRVRYAHRCGERLETYPQLTGRPAIVAPRSMRVSADVTPAYVRLGVLDWCCVGALLASGLSDHTFAQAPCASGFNPIR